MSLRPATSPRKQRRTGADRRFTITALTVLTLSLCGCSDQYWDMQKQNKYDTFRPAYFFSDGASARPLVEGTVNRRGAVSSEAPDPTLVPRPPLTPDLLARGQVLFNVNCSPCHARDGYGDGMVVQRGYPRPPSLHEERLRTLPDEHIYQVITFGLGKMPVYGVDIPPADRWPIVAYVRALQLSQHAPLRDAPPEAQQLLAQAAATSQPVIVPAESPPFTPTPGRSRIDGASPGSAAPPASAASRSAP